ncbi:ABC transporter substrate-binding protein (plasmid) [Candidatus Pantoea edessiphila]|uniref:ABC transporter substrate-binding protein n=1 Tax=Candidatus Pantoea edessiphila TaxID=2044610 RepID=A0A2P5T157_9GAMM|nr:DUF2076 domain-containing protein [Candidatus Pantoea edessiphila]PPI88321.1 ABC transporter substrate-binding protein [Candidatus Pantoea edessiphila]
MQLEEKQLIERLFQKIKKAEEHASNRDSEAEEQIKDHIKQQPAAPYYMVQSILIQEAALNKLNQQVIKLKDEVLELQRLNQTKGKTFLSKLFSGNKPSEQTVPLNTKNTVSSENSIATTAAGPAPAYSIPRSSGSSFMSGALQTAAGVAGGVVIGNLLNNMFHHTAPEEIINIIDDPHSSMHNSPLHNNDSLLDNNDSLLQSNELGEIDHLDTTNHNIDSQFSNYDGQLSDGNDFEIDSFGDDDFI